LESGHALCIASTMFRTSVVFLVALLAACTPKPPLVVTATGAGEACTVSVNGAEFTDREFTQSRLQRLAKEHAGRLVVSSDSRTPYRCIGGAIFNLQRAGFRVMAVRVDGVELSNR
jgi:biopolymer transport protein ExbD